MVLPLFAVTLFTSAFLLFLVQPIIGATILPSLGGTPQVWNTCMVFFQTVLLAGYAYTHSTSTWLPTKRQVLLHCCLLFIPLLVLIVLPAHGPFDISGRIPPQGANPIPWTLLLLATVVGIPFFVVATSAPLLQKWFANTGHPSAQDPYFLYAASNLGSMLGLLCYPFFVEPFFKIHATEAMNLGTQPWLWTSGYLVMMVLFFACAAVVLFSPPSVKLAGAGGPQISMPVENAPSPPPAAPAEQGGTATAVSVAPPVAAPKATGIKKGSKQGKHARQQAHAKRDLGTKTGAKVAAITAVPASNEVTTARRLRWVALAAVPSSLMLGTITLVSTDVSSSPIFWVVALALYLLSFILVFLRWPEPWVGLPHRVVLLVQPAFLLVAVYVSLNHFIDWAWTMGMLTAAFFLTALACHGELAKDRPPTKHLTEFYLWMSVGGMVGGMFNALIAPILFTYVIEFSLALMVAGLVLPRTKVGGWTDDFVNEMQNKNQPQRPTPGRGNARKGGEPEEANPIHGFLDVALPVGLFILALILLFVGDSFGSVIDWLGKGVGLPKAGVANLIRWGTQFVMFGIPLIIVFLYAGRPLRYGLGIGAVLLASGINSYATDKSVKFADRSFYSVIRVNERTDKFGTYRTLMHATTDHGMNFISPPELRRLATTYYHRTSPVGYVMEKMFWFHEPKTPVEVTDHVTHKQKSAYVWWSDARMPASLIGLGAANPLGVGNLPLEQLVGAWSEPAYATIGLGTGTMAVYAHPYQHMHFYEIDRQVLYLSKPPTANRTMWFTNVDMAEKRGVELHILMGDARLRMNQPWTPSWEPDHWEKTGGPEHFYTALIVDAFSSDSIPIHLITRDAFEVYFKKLTEKGILCMHTSNRHVDLVRVCADIAMDMGYAWRRGHSEDKKDEDPGCYGSQWVMIARKEEYLNADSHSHWKGLVEPSDEQPDPRTGRPRDERSRAWSSYVYWNRPGAYVWTDDFHNMLSVFRPFLSDNE